MGLALVHFQKYWLLNDMLLKKTKQPLKKKVKANYSRTVLFGQENKKFKLSLLAGSSLYL